MPRNDDFYEQDYDRPADVCPGCQAGYSGAHGAYACGWPSADCPAMVAEMEAEEVHDFWTGDDETYISLSELAQVSP